MADKSKEGGDSAKKEPLRLWCANEIIEKERKKIDLRRGHAENPADGKKIGRDELSHHDPKYPDQKPLSEEVAKGVLQPGYIGLAFSGGGIRSATFALGIAQALARAKLLK